MISQISSTSITYTSPVKPNRRFVSFKSTGDIYTPSITPLYGLLGKKEAENLIKASSANQKCGSGFRSNIFQINGLILKSPKTPEGGQPLTDFLAEQNIKEFYALKEIEKINPDIAPKAHDVIEHKGAFHLVEDFVAGIHPHKGKISNQNLRDLLPKFAQLDQHGISNCDLQSGNIFLLGNGKTKLIDFGSFSFLNNEGFIIGSDSLPGFLFKPGSDFIKSIEAPNTIKFAKSFFTQGYNDIKNLADNPHLNIPSNIVNFEFRTLYRHLMDGKEEKPLEFFTEYLKSKGELYHGKMQDFLKTISFSDIISEGQSPEKVEQAKSALSKAINYEGLAKEVLQNPTDGILKTELGKIQVRTFLNTDSFNSTIPNSKKIQSAYNQLLAILEKNISSSEGKQKEYYTETLTALKERFKNVVFEEGQVEIPDDENLIKKLFNEAKTKLQPEEKIDNTISAIKKNNKKFFALIAIGIAAIGAGIVILYKKDKLKFLNKKKPATTANTNNNPVKNNTFNHSTPKIFSQFA